MTDVNQKETANTGNTEDRNGVAKGKKTQRKELPAKQHHKTEVKEPKNAEKKADNDVVLSKALGPQKSASEPCHSKAYRKGDKSSTSPVKRPQRAHRKRRCSTSENVKEEFPEDNYSGHTHSSDSDSMSNNEKKVRRIMVVSSPHEAKLNSHKVSNLEKFHGCVPQPVRINMNNKVVSKIETQEEGVKSATDPAKCSPGAHHDYRQNTLENKPFPNRRYSKHTKSSSLRLSSDKKEGVIKGQTAASASFPIDKDRIGVPQTVQNSKIPLKEKGVSKLKVHDGVKHTSNHPSDTHHECRSRILENKQSPKRYYPQYSCSYGKEEEDKGQATASSVDVSQTVQETEISLKRKGALKLKVQRGVEFIESSTNPGGRPLGAHHSRRRSTLENVQQQFPRHYYSIHARFSDLHLSGDEDEEVEGQLIPSPDEAELNNHNRGSVSSLDEAWGRSVSQPVQWTETYEEEVESELEEIQGPTSLVKRPLGAHHRRRRSIMDNVQDQFPEQYYSSYDHFSDSDLSSDNEEIEQQMAASLALEAFKAEADMITRRIEAMSATLSKRQQGTPKPVQQTVSELEVQPGQTEKNSDSAAEHIPAILLRPVSRRRHNPDDRPCALGFVAWS